MDWVYVKKRQVETVDHLDDYLKEFAFIFPFVATRIKATFSS